MKMQTLVAELVEVLGACLERVGSSTTLPPASCILSISSIWLILSSILLQ